MTDEPEHLDVGAGRPRRPVLLVLVGIFVLVVVVFAIGVGRTGSSTPDTSSAPTPTPRTTTTPPALRVDPTTASAPLPTRLPQGTTRGSGPLAEGVPAGTLYLRTKSSVYAIVLDTGSITRTDKVTTGADGPEIASMVPTRTGVVVQVPYGESPGVLIQDGRAASALPGQLGDAAFLLPGPTDQVWTVSGNDEDRATLTDARGGPVGPPVTTGYGSFEPDGDGGLLLTDVGGTWQAFPGPLRRITTGRVIATGPGHYQILECDDQHQCSEVLQSRETGNRTTLAPRVREDLSPGIVSPDGVFAAVQRFGDDGGTRTTITRLIDGQDLGSVPVPESSEGDTRQLAAWLDQRWIALVDDGRLTLYDTTTQTSTTPKLPVTGLIQLAWRAG